MRIEAGGITYKLSFTFIAFTVFMMLICDEKIVFMSLFSSLIHEGGHLFFIFLTGDRPKNVEMTLFGMRIDRAESPELSYFKESLIAAGGIIFNLIFAIICYIIFLVLNYRLFLMLSVVNAVIMLVNSVPVSVLDFGRVLKYILHIFFDSGKCDKILNCISFVFIGIFLGFTVLYCLFIDVNFSLIAATIYILLITVIKKWS